MKRPNKMMVDHLNLILEKEGSCLRYVRNSKDCDTVVVYNLLVVDKYISNQINIPIITDELDNNIRQFFTDYGVENIGFRNTVMTIFVEEK